MTIKIALWLLTCVCAGAGAYSVAGWADIFFRRSKHRLTWRFAISLAILALVIIGEVIICHNINW